MKLILEAIKSLIRKVENLAKVNASQIDGASKRLSRVSDTANNAQRAAKKAQATADAAQKIADEAQALAADAKDAANSAANEAERRAKIWTAKWERKDGDISGALDLNVGETFKITKEGFFSQSGWGKDSVVLLTVSYTLKSDPTSIFTEKISLMAINSYRAGGIYSFWTPRDDTDIRAFAVHVANLANTSFIQMTRIA